MRTLFWTFILLQQPKKIFSFQRNAARLEMETGENRHLDFEITTAVRYEGETRFHNLRKYLKRLSISGINRYFLV